MESCVICLFNFSELLPSKKLFPINQAMLFMQQLSQNADVAGGMLASQQMESQQSSQVVKKCLAQYISKQFNIHCILYFIFKHFAYCC